MRINVKKGTRKIELTKREFGVLEEATNLLIELSTQLKFEGGLGDDADTSADAIANIVRCLKGETYIAHEPAGANA